MEGPSASVCRTDGADPRLLGHRTVGGKQQMLQMMRLEELQAGGRKAAEKDEVHRVAKTVGLGWARVLREAKVRVSKSKGSEVVGNLQEGARVLVVEVSSKSARIHLPFAGWVVLEKTSGPVLEQDPYNCRQPGEMSATQRVVEDTLVRLRACEADQSPIQEKEQLTAHLPVLANPDGQAVPPKGSFELLPSVATWLVAKPKAITGGGSPVTPKYSFAQSPSVATWLAAKPASPQPVPKPLAAPAEPSFAQPHPVNTASAPDVPASGAPACAFSMLPSVATWLAAKPTQLPATKDAPATDSTDSTQSSPGYMRLGDWWIAFCKSAQQTLCCSR
ncbi:unnamed protein product [Symbiodinium natans]|uniref:Uncharacterized protein n=1 Tax=Symbiodinium natans TaxID=878477 RepID=A0A812UZQ4_9DINO|nr:unnamed protein product [Symbiodinium natans]